MEKNKKRKKEEKERRERQKRVWAGERSRVFSKTLKVLDSKMADFGFF